MFGRSIKHVFRRASNPFKALKIIIKRKLGWLGVPLIIPYTAFGNQDKVFLTGAVIEDKGLARPGQGQTIWQNMLAMIKRYAGDEIAGVRVSINYNDTMETVRTNEQGLFHTVLPVTDPDHDISHPSPILVRYTLLDEVVPGQGRIENSGEVHFISRNVAFIVVSDIDDTVLVSHSTKMLKKLRLLMFKNALTRKTFEGVAAFYRALCQPGSDHERPIFYVSSSEWNLYDLLVDFLEHNGIPGGSLLLSNQKMNLFSMRRSGKKHLEKFQKISELFEHFHRQQFILIGDSGQKDPEIYLKLVENYPSRVRAVYIRYSGGKKRNKRLDELVHEAKELGTEMIPVHDTTEAAKHAMSQGYIDDRQRAAIEAGKRMEEAK